MSKLRTAPFPDPTMVVVLGIIFLAIGIQPGSLLAQSETQSVAGVSFQAAGTLALKLAPEEELRLAQLAERLRWSFEFTVSGRQWTLRTVNSHGLEAWLSYDGQDYYRTTHETLAPRKATGACVTSKSPISSLVEHEKIVLYAFGQSTSLAVDVDGRFQVPFLSLPNPATTIYRHECERAAVAPYIPLRASFSVSPEQLEATLKALSKEGPRASESARTRWLAYLKERYSENVEAARYELLDSTPVADIQLPLKFQIVHPYNTAQGTHKRRFLGEITRWTVNAQTPVLPPLMTNSFVQHSRLGRTYGYEAVAGRWLAAHEAAAVGRIMVSGPPSFPPGENPFRRVAQWTIRTAFVVLVGGPLCVLVWKRRKRAANDLQRIS